MIKCKMLITNRISSHLFMEAKAAATINHSIMSNTQLKAHIKDKKLITNKISAHLFVAAKAATTIPPKLIWRFSMNMVIGAS